MNALVVLPTYEERTNLARIATEILAQDGQLHLLVIDDASPDGTGDLADSLAAADSRIHVMHRAGKLGQGSAYVEGFRWALRETNAAFIIQMDADFSHAPNAIPDFLAAAETEDLVLGSRYRDGIRVLNWPLSRLALSLAANRYAALVANVSISDLTSGFKCFRRAALERFDLESIRSEGYAFHIEMSVRACQLGLRVREIPIVFADRVEGSSKLSPHILWEAAWIVWLLRFTRPRARPPQPDSAASDAEPRRST